VRFKRGAYRFGLSYLYLGYRVPTVTDSATDPPSNFVGSGHTQLVTASVEAEIRGGSLF
jgi:hypothetical protein